jgi:hypothetical protein
MAVQEYKKRGGGYLGEKPDADNHLVQWQREEWGTKSGRESLKSGERYLPKKAWEALSDEEYKRTTAAKRCAAAKGEQFAAPPQDVAREGLAFPRRPWRPRREDQGRPARAGPQARACPAAPHDQGAAGSRVAPVTAARRACTTAPLLACCAGLLAACAAPAPPPSPVLAAPTAADPAAELERAPRRRYRRSYPAEGAARRVSGRPGLSASFRRRARRSMPRRSGDPRTLRVRGRGAGAGVPSSNGPARPVRPSTAALIYPE